MSAAVIVTTPEELARLVRQAVREELEERDRERVAVVEATQASDWIGPAEAATMLGVSRDYMRRVKGVPAHHVGNRIRFSRTELAEWIRSRPPRPSKRKAA